MRAPIIFAEDDSDYGSFLKLEDELPDTPIERVFWMFKLLLINLVFGCVCTIICFKVKRFVGNLVSWLLCGVCGDFDCDYDGSQPRSSWRKPANRKIILSKENRNSLHTLWLACKSIYSNKKLLKPICMLLIGVSLGYMLLHQENLKRGHETSSPIYSLNNVSRFNNQKRIFFVMPTLASGIQHTRLIRIAQAIFPSRDYVTWVMVSSDPVSKYPWHPHGTEHWNSLQISKWKENESRIMTHLEDLQLTVSRFGIPFVILSGHEVHHGNKGFTWPLGFSRKESSSVSQLVDAFQVGISWVVKTFKDGIIFVGHEDAAYNSNLFREVQTTHILSTWPTAFDPRFRLSLTLPILRNGTATPAGYFVGGNIKMDEMPLQYASYAVNMSLAKKLQAANELWKLTSDFLYTSKDLDVQNENVQALGKNNSEIYVWKLSTTFSHATVINQQKIPLKFKWIYTNIGRLYCLIGKWFARDLSNPRNVTGKVEIMSTCRYD